jgi:lipid-A-disaccharide synthase
MKQLKIYVTCGEASGDLQASFLVSAIKKHYPNNVLLYGIGGKELSNLGQQQIYNITSLSVMGIIEILPKLFSILRIIRSTVRDIITIKPDIIITVDSPDLNIRIVRKLANRISSKTKFIQLIAPSVWAYNEKRALVYAKYYDLLISILPFEKKYFVKYGLRTIYIGHPLVTLQTQANKSYISDFIEKYSITKNFKIITITLGSRLSEVKKHLPIIAQTLNMLYKNERNIIILLATFDHFKEVIKIGFMSVSLRYFFITQDHEKQISYQICDLAIAKSGTNNIEICNHKRNIITIYKANWLTYFIAKLFLKTKYINIINIMNQREIIPELVQRKFTVKSLLFHIYKYLNDENIKSSQIRSISKSLEILESRKFNKQLVDEIIKID